jgi:hypothetical protein
VVARVIASFLGRRFNETVTLAAQLNPLMDSVRNDILDRDAVNQDIYQVDRALALGLTCRRAAAGMLTGTSHLVATAARNFERVVDAARQSGDIQRYWLARRLKRAADRMHDASMHRVLADAGIVTSYRTALARDGILELWRPQREAIAAGCFGAASRATSSSAYRREVAKRSSRNLPSSMHCAAWSRRGHCTSRRVAPSPIR